MVYGCIRQKTWGVNLYVSNPYTKLLIFESPLYKETNDSSFSEKLEGLVYKMIFVNFCKSCC